MSISRAANRLIQHNDIDLYQYPKSQVGHEVDSRNQLTLGDLNGSALFLIYFLVSHKVMEISEADYKALVDLYKMDYVSIEAKHLQKFSAILARATFNPVGTIRLLGDEFADRGSNDYFTLKILEKLSLSGIHTEVLISNHSMEFLEAYEKRVNFDSIRFIFEHARSLFGLNYIVKRGLVKLDEFDQIVCQHYKPMLKVISYTLSEDKQSISLFSHAGIDLEIVEKLAHIFRVKFAAESIVSLTETIDAINMAFNEYLKKDMVHTLYSSEEIFRGYTDSLLGKADNPLVFTMWNRRYYELKRLSKSEKGDYSINYIHGHDSRESTHNNIYNLDNLLAKSPNFMTGNFNVLYSQDYPAPRLQEEYPLPVRNTPVVVEPIARLPIELDVLVANQFELDASSIDAMKSIVKDMQKTYDMQEQVNKRPEVNSFTQSLLEKISTLQSQKFTTKEAANLYVLGFKQSFATLLHSKDQEFKKHTNLWHPFLAKLSNALLCLTVIGIVPVILRYLTARKQTGRGSVFFSQTNREKYVDRIAIAMNNVRVGSGA